MKKVSIIVVALVALGLILAGIWSFMPKTSGETALNFGAIYQEKHFLDRPEYGFSVYLPTDYEVNGGVSFGEEIPSFEGPREGTVRAYNLTATPHRPAEAVLEEIEENSYDMFFKGRETVNGLDVVKYEAAGLCSYAIVEVIGKDYNYVFIPACSVDLEQDFDYFTQIVETMRLYAPAWQQQVLDFDSYEKVASNDPVYLDLSGQLSSCPNESLRQIVNGEIKKKRIYSADGTVYRDLYLTPNYERIAQADLRAISCGEAGSVFPQKAYDGMLVWASLNCGGAVADQEGQAKLVACQAFADEIQDFLMNSF